MPLDIQTPVDSPFGARSTAREVVEGLDLSGRLAVITGGYSGIGLETTRALAEAGARIIVPARNPGKAEAALKDVDGVSIEALDLSDRASVKAFAGRRLEAGTPVDLLINNAGIMATPERRTAEGWEMQFATNHLGHFALFMHLRPLLKTAPSPRVVALSSLAHQFSAVDFDDPMFERREYDKWQAYGQSKTANALFAVGVASRFADDGILAYSVHPGGIMTDLQRDLAQEEMRAMGWIDEEGRLHEQFKTPEQGAATTVWAATSPDIVERSGAYCEDCEIAVPVEERGRSGVRAWAVEDEAADRLWRLSEQLTGLRI